MALALAITLPNRTTGSYIRLGPRRVDDPRLLNREAVAYFFLFVDKEAADAAPDMPVNMGPIACLRLVGTDYDRFFSKAALQAAGWNYDGQFYAALKSATPAQLCPGGGLQRRQSPDFSAAQDV